MLWVYLHTCVYVYICIGVGIGGRGGMAPTFWPSLTHAGSGHPPHEIRTKNQQVWVAHLGGCGLNFASYTHELYAIPLVTPHLYLC